MACDGFKNILSEGPSSVGSIAFLTGKDPRIVLTPSPHGRQESPYPGNCSSEADVSEVRRQPTEQGRMTVHGEEPRVNEQLLSIVKADISRY